VNVMIKLNGRLLARFSGYLFGALLIFIGGYYILWALQSASFSVAAAESVAQAIYKARAEVMFPIGFLFVVVGILYIYIIFIGRARKGR